MKINDCLISSTYVKVHGLKIHYLMAGEGNPVVLIHGTPASSCLWRNIIGPLANTRQVIAPDLPGFGKSDKPLDAPYTFNYYSEVLNGFFHILGIKQAALVVHDLGGPAGLLWAVRNPEKVERLVIMETGIYTDIPLMTKLLLSIVFIPGLRNWLVSPSGFAFMMKLAVANKKVMTKELIADYYAPFAPAEAKKVFLKTTQVIVRSITTSNPNELTEIREKIKLLKIPIHLIYAECDRFGTALQMQRFKQDLPDARLTVISNSGHFIQEDQPERLSELLIQFLAE